MNSAVIQFKVKEYIKVTATKNNATVFVVWVDTFFSGIPQYIISVYIVTKYVQIMNEIKTHFFLGGKKIHSTFHSN